MLVKEAVHEMGVPVAYMQLDDWWYQGPFYFGNVKEVVDWQASDAFVAITNMLQVMTRAGGRQLAGH